MIATPCKDSKKLNVLIALLVIAIAAFLRLWDLHGVNNYIDDGSSRQLIGAMDTLRGIPHFPRLPSIFEYDDGGLAQIFIPIMWLFGTQYIIYQVFTALCGALATGVVYFFGLQFFNRTTGIVAALFCATLPAFLLWDRVVYFAGADIMNSLTLLSSMVLAYEKWNINWRLIVSGVFCGLGAYFSGLMILVIPGLAISILLLPMSSQSSSGWKIKMKHISLLGISTGIMASPLIFSLLISPDYIIWRRRHFPEHSGCITWVSNTFSMILDLMQELFYSVTHAQYFKAGYPFIPYTISLLIPLGIFLVYRQRKSFGTIQMLIYPLSWLSLASGLKTEPWREGYYPYIIPFLLIYSACGLQYLTCELRKRVPVKLWAILAYTFIFVICIWNSYDFFIGKHKYFMRDDNITKLQIDLEGRPDIPHFFSARINDVLHYHFPFWYVTRSHLSKVTIFDIANGTWILMPDRLEISMHPSEFHSAFIIRREDEQEFLALAGSDRLVSREILPVTQLCILTCKVEADPAAQRTWQISSVPPILNIVQNSAAK